MKFSSSLLLSVFCGSLLSSTSTLPGQVDVLKKTSETFSIHLPVLSGASGAEATKILTSDLQRSGRFEIVSGGADYSLSGSATSASVSCKVVDRDGKTEVSTSAEGNLRRAAHKIADEIVFKLTGQKGMAQSRIAFLSDKSGKRQLYVMDYDGENIMRFNDEGARIMGSPNFNKQGTKIVYTAYRPTFPDVLVMSYPAGSKQTVAKYGGLNDGGAFSPDGSRLAIILSKDGNPELYTMSAGGGTPKRLTRTGGGESSPSWSPDGSDIVYASDQGGRPQLYIVSSAGGEGRRITSSPAYNTSPSWSSESGLIAYASSGSPWAISVLDPKEGGGQVVYSDGSCEDPSWSPNGRHLVFSRKSGGQTELYLLDTVKKEAVQLTRGFGNCTEPTWAGR